MDKREIPGWKHVRNSVGYASECHSRDLDVPERPSCKTSAHQARTLAVVSCKGGSGRVSFDDRKNFSEAIAGIEGRLPGWTVRAVVATQLDPAKLSASNMGNSSEFIVWGSHDLQLLWDATSAQQMTGLLWDDPRFPPSTLAGFGDSEDPL